MAQAAAIHDVEPRSISFKGAVQTLQAFQPVIAIRGRHDLAFRLQLYQQLLQAITIHRVADRPNRFEPRLRKRRIDRPHIVIRPTIAKGGVGRRVPLWWDRGTLEDIATWVATRRAQGASGSDPLVCSLQPRRYGVPLGRHVLRKRFRTACRVLGIARLSNLTIHHGRHTFISHALAGDRTLAEVRDAAGHTNVSITSCYLHVVGDDEGALGELFSL